MKISLNALKKYIDIDIPISELLTLIGARLVEIEGTEDLSEKYKGIKIVKVKTCEKIEGTHLSLCKIQKNEDENDLVQVVCGAPNVHAGMLTAWIMPGSIVPETYGNEDFRLSVRKLRGFESYGMLAAADELGFCGASHDGIIEVDPRDAKPGDDFATVYDLNDVILDIENKSLTHRPDTFGLIGFAREVAGIMGKKFNEPELFKDKKYALNNKTVRVEIEDESLCPRYSCAVIDLKQEDEKYFTKEHVFLYKSGMRPVSRLVDMTNVIMLETGQPLHAFDYDKFISQGKSKTPNIVVRAAREGETLLTLDDRNIELLPTDIVICSDDCPVALAGAIGGKSTEIDASTSKIILESATFSLYNLRKTQMAHGIFSEAITRFTKGQSTFQTLPVLFEIIDRMNVTPNEVIDIEAKKPKENAIEIKAKEINDLLGTNYSLVTIKNALENVGFVVNNDEDDNTLTVISPKWRTDIHIKEDITEEVGRLLGYDNIPLSMPTRSFDGANNDNIFSFKSLLRDICSDKLNMNEVLTYSFVSKNLIEKTLGASDDLYKITNSISPELEYFRGSLIPSLLGKIRENEKAGFEDFSIYEINQISKKSFGLTSDNVPNMKNHLAVVTEGDFYKLKSLVLRLMNKLGIETKISPVKNPMEFLEPKHSASLIIDGEELCSFGEINQRVQNNFKLKNTISVFECDINTLLEKKTTKIPSISSSKFPSVTRDVTIKVSSTITYENIESQIRDILEEENIKYNIDCVSIYREKETDSFRNISFRITLKSDEKTLESSEVSAIIEKIESKEVYAG